MLKKKRCFQKMAQRHPRAQTTLNKYGSGLFCSLLKSLSRLQLCFVQQTWMDVYCISGCDHDETVKVFYLILTILVQAGGKRGSSMHTPERWAVSAVS